MDRAKNASLTWLAARLSRAAETGSNRLAGVAHANGVNGSKPWTSLLTQPNLLGYFITGHARKLSARCAHPSDVEVDAIVYYITQSKKPATQELIAPTRHAPAPSPTPSTEGAKSSDKIVCSGIVLKGLKGSAEHFEIKVRHDSRHFGIALAYHNNGGEKDGSVSQNRVGLSMN